jgi:hypothetical protein
MGRDTFISIVTEQGSSEPKWTGSFKYDEVKGYRGSIISAYQKPEAGKDDFSTPKELEGSCLYCVLDGSRFGTIVQPELRGVEIKNFISHIRGLRIKTLINGIHISESEQAIKKIRIESQIIGQLFKLRAFDETIHTAPSRKLTIESKSFKGIEFNSSIGKVTVGIDGSYSPAWNRLAPRLSANVT